MSSFKTYDITCLIHNTIPVFQFNLKIKMENNYFVYSVDPYEKC